MRVAVQIIVDQKDESCEFAIPECRTDSLPVSGVDDLLQPGNDVFFGCARQISPLCVVPFSAGCGKVGTISKSYNLNHDFTSVGAW